MAGPSRLDFDRLRATIYAGNTLMVVNFILVLMPWRRGFVASDFGIGIGAAYGLLCSALSVFSILRVKRLRRSIGWFKVTILAVWNLLLGILGGTNSLGGLYTSEFGRQADATYTVTDVRLHPRSGRCYDHTLAELSLVQSYLNTHCMELGYAPGTRFHFQGLRSPLGFKEGRVEIETTEPPLPRRE